MGRPYWGFRRTTTKPVSMVPKRSRKLRHDSQRGPLSTSKIYTRLPGS